MTTHLPNSRRQWLLRLTLFNPPIHRTGAATHGEHTMPARGLAMDAMLHKGKQLSSRLTITQYVWLAIRM